MKVLSIKEPFASLIKNQLKQYETRSWKTNYRGKILIHASLSIDSSYKNRPDLLNIINSNKLIFNPGYILCEATLTDCIYMDNDFIKTVKPNELACGQYAIGRYAWKLENIKVIEPINAKGKLGLWEYKYEEDK